MALITWNETLHVGVVTIDQEHRKLVDMLNRLHDAMKAGKGADLLGGLLAELVAYTKTHFGNEERLMKRHNYPDYLKHKKEHNYLVLEAQKALELHQQGQHLRPHDVQQFLVDWLTQHIKDEDRQTGRFLAGKGVV
jgi:hemerythrin